MKSTSEILERISQNSKEHRNGIYTRLYRYLLRDDIYINTYKNLYKNKSITNIEIEKINDLINKLKNVEYTPNPSKSILIKKNNEIKRIFIPSLSDILLQDVIAQFLEAIYEPLINFNTNRFNVLNRVRKEFGGVRFFIRGDIETIERSDLIVILQKKIKDSKFINIIRKFLKSEYIDNYYFLNKNYKRNKLFYILEAIYYSEFDESIEDIKKEFYKNSMSNDKYNNGIIKVKKFCYVRCNNTFLIGIYADKEECNFVKLKLEKLFIEKYRINRKEQFLQLIISTESIEFLDYIIKINNKKEIELLIPFNTKIKKWLFEKGIVIQKKETGQLFPIDRGKIGYLSDNKIISVYKSEMNKVLKYYNLANNRSILKFYCYLMKYSCLKTIARKHKTTLKKTIEKYRYLLKDS